MIAFLVLLALAVAILLWAILIYNALVRMRNMVQEAWSGIDVQLKRRTDLIPNLVSTVKGYAEHEKGTLEEVIRLRGLAQNAHGVGETAHAQGLLGAALGKLFALAENYPELKANANFAQLQASLGEIEEQVQLARRYYNGAVRNLNIAVESFPSNLVAGRFGFEKAEFFELESPAERAVPKVEF
ncbi:MAG: LemA family protein [Desulfomicrobium sp.]|nr:LemA family protein [Pseudomonadota bacterium]MBV1712393.1 LemA family protein [Desulfomicrobium sp.]MBU4572553.1 LemA family protein [Pseudomonadota bacterium]MBU4595113.1 LemA family protein [Pseudomonadota bacterium]MBV1719393.1 LemA family protein [Desulfomicrobium sp.]